MYLISSCLVGVKCRYNGTSVLDAGLKQMIEEGKAIAVCPEVLGGLPTPREPCEIQVIAGVIKVVGKSGTDYTQPFTQGAQKTLEICRAENITTAVLKSRSPSCGFGKIYDGCFKGALIDGNGLTADLLSKNGIEVLSDENWSTK